MTEYNEREFQNDTAQVLDLPPHASENDINSSDLINKINIGESSDYKYKDSMTILSNEGILCMSNGETRKKALKSLAIRINQSSKSAARGYFLLVARTSLRAIDGGCSINEVISCDTFSALKSLSNNGQNLIESNHSTGTESRSAIKDKSHVEIENENKFIISLLNIDQRAVFDRWIDDNQKNQIGNPHQKKPQYISNSDEQSNKSNDQPGYSFAEILSIIEEFKIRIQGIDLASHQDDNPISAQIREINKELSEAIQLITTKILAAQCNIFLPTFNSHTNSPASWHEFTSWLISRSEVVFSEFRAHLLPLDLLPGAVIDEINEIALDLTGELALEEDGDSVIVQREVLLQVIAAWSE